MSKKYRFEELTTTQQEQAQGRFLDAGPGDGYRYELDRDGMVLCRHRKVRARIANATGGHVLLLENGAVEFDLYAERNLTEYPAG